MLSIIIDILHMSMITIYNTIITIIITIYNISFQDQYILYYLLMAMYA